MITLILYLFLFYFVFLNTSVGFIADQNLFQIITVTAGGTNYNITTTNYYNFQNAYAGVPQTVAGLQSLSCAIDGYNGAPNYSATAYNGSNTWFIFVVCGLITLGNNFVIQFCYWYLKSSKFIYWIRLKPGLIVKMVKGSLTSQISS